MSPEPYCQSPQHLRYVSQHSQDIFTDPLVISRSHGPYISDRAHISNYEKLLREFHDFQMPYKR